LLLRKSFTGQFLDAVRPPACALGNFRMALTEYAVFQLS
jgi:hypothetical protein